MISIIGLIEKLVFILQPEIVLVKNQKS